MKKIELSGAPNTRDLGGLTTRYGKIKYGRLIRSGELSRLTDSDADALKKLGLRRVIDLRTEKERLLTPDVVIDGVSYINNPIIENTTFGITYEQSSGEEVAVMLAKGLERMAARNETPEEHLALLYGRFVTDAFSLTHYSSFLKLLSDGTPGATLWHCTAGKDRVGTCTALLLYILGASKEDITEDYLFTNISSRANTLSVLNKVRPHLSDDAYALVSGMLRVEKRYLQTFFGEIDAKYGNIDSFIKKALNFTDADAEKLRSLYLD